MNKRLDPKKSSQTNVPFVQSVAPGASTRMKSSTMNWTISGSRCAALAPSVPRPLPVRSPTPGERPLRPLLPTAYPNIDMLINEIRNFSLNECMPTLIDEQCSRRYRQVSITYTDPSGGSMIITRRREDGHFDVRVVYSRDFIVAASASPLALLPPPNFRQMVLEMMEIIAKFPKSYYNTISRDSASTGPK
ncbi:unnamed protein product [Acanthocheilonema viteae]|uniref:Uncharacterized protein n=1 Tax=Acanthocheilonema viteae TaxID=6277 RepID=A0A498SHA2_ACAVI|nr:unnamed protein product [Acanthocheilonema viteae]